MGPPHRRAAGRARAGAMLAFGGLIFAACGDDGPKPASTRPAGPLPAPPAVSTPAGAPGAPRPLADPPPPPIPETATAHEVSNVLRAALEDDQDLRFAVPALRRLVTAHDGMGTDSTGRRPLSASVLAGAVAMRAADLCREAVEGREPDAARARAMLDVGTAALAAADAGDAPEAADLARARAWVDLAGPPFAAHRVGRAEGRRAEAYVLVVTDDFELGETLLLSVLRRWAKGAPVEIVARLTGHVRAGMRRERADEAREAAAVRVRIAAIGGEPAGVLREGDPRVEASGLGPGTSIFLVRAGGVLVARCAGRTLDPRVLDERVRATFPDVPAPPR